MFGPLAPTHNTILRFLPTDGGGLGRTAGLFGPDLTPQRGLVSGKGAWPFTLNLKCLKLKLTQIILACILSAAN